MQGDVRVVEVHPIRHALGHRSPGRLVRPHRFAAGLVEVVHAVRFDRFVAHQVHALLNFDLHRKAVGVPAAFSFNLESLHRFPAADEVLVGASHDVVNARFAVRRGRALEENERCTVLPGGDGLAKRILHPPCFQQGGFECHSVQFSGGGQARHGACTLVLVFNLTRVAVALWVIGAPSVVVGQRGWPNP